MKLYLLFFVMSASLHSFSVLSQTKSYENQTETILCSESNSVFKDCCEYMSHQASANGLFFISFKGKNITKKVNSLDGKFTVVPDSEQVYDCSFKKYSVQMDKTSFFSYDYYYLSNKISYNFEGENYMLSTIDGSCDTCIKELKISHIKKDTGEIMLIEFQKDVHLLSKKANTLTIKKGSYCIFVM